MDKKTNIINISDFNKKDDKFFIEDLLYRKEGNMELNNEKSDNLIDLNVEKIKSFIDKL